VLYRFTKYIPHAPTSIQGAFLLSCQREVFYGGAAGGGKTDALLMAALQYVDIPKYAAVVFRKTLADAKQPGSVMSRAQDWLMGTDAKWNAQDYYWRFPSGAILKFGYLDKPMDKYKYRSAEFSFMGFDEVTDFWEEDFTFVTSRLRHPRCPWHSRGRDYNCRTCKEYAPVSRVPLRIRVCGNPGGVGHMWVKNRYEIKQHPSAKTPYGTPLYCGQNEEKPHIPAFLRDNPFLDEEEYLGTLQGLDPVTREQLISGDWGVSEDGRFRKSWAKYYSIRGRYVVLDGKAYDIQALRTFCVCDPAATTRDTPGKTEIYKVQGSWTVIMTIKVTPDNHILVWDVQRIQDELPMIVQAIQTTVRHYEPEAMCLERTSMSAHLLQLLEQMGLPIRPLFPKTLDKVARSVDIANRMEQGRVWFNEEAEWLDDLEDELYVWIGDPAQTSDQIDCLAYAALYVTEQASFVDSTPFVYQPVR
jgi:predicted phage terminase large subunit-like protein